MTEKIPMYLKLAHAIVDDGSSSTNEFILAELAIRQHEEIEMLKRERDEAYERAARACDDERLCDPTDMDGDIAYNNAIDDAAKAIRALKAKP